jgi:hypothetical protein
MDSLIYLLPLRYPTEKAYGVTVGNTLSSISNHFHSTQIWCDSEVKKDSFGIEIQSIKIPKLRRFIGIPGGRIFGAFHFYFRLMTFARETQLHFRSRGTGNYIWTRHPITLLFIYKSKKTSKLAIEFHQTPNLLDRFLTRRYISAKPVLIIGITEKSVQELSKLFPAADILKAEMGVPQDYVSNPDTPLPHEIKIGYVGKSTSSGNDNNLNLILEGFSLLEDSEMTLEFVGLEPAKKKELLELAQSLNIPQEKITFIDHVDHKYIGKILSELTIGILPYQWTEYNSHRFPIKLVEYAAAGLWILTDSAFADGLNLNENLVLRYKSGDKEALAKKMQQLATQISLNPVRNRHAIAFASERTYFKRAELIADEIRRCRNI